MSYKLLSVSVPGIKDLILHARDTMPIKNLLDTTVDALVASGQVVQLTPATGALLSGDSTLNIWCAAQMQDNPATEQVEFFACMIAGKAGQPWVKANGMPVGTFMWHPFPVDVVANQGIAAIRKGLLLFLAGEPQEATPPIIEDHNDTIQSHLSIITRANAAWQLEQGETGAF